MKIRRQLNHIFKTLAMLWELDKTLFILSVCQAVLSSSIPYIEIYLSAFVLDHLADGLSIKPFLKTVLLVLGAILLLRIVIAYLQKILDIHRELCGKKFDMLMGIRTLTMDYELLESPHTNEIRNQIRNDNNWGAGFYSILWQFPSMISSIINLIFAVAILIPLFTDSSLFRDFSALPILLFFITIIILYTHFSAKKRAEMHTLLNRSSAEYGYRGYYLWNRQEYKNGMDIRIFQGQKVIEKYCMDENENDKYWIRRATANRCQNGLANGISTGLLQTTAYLFVAFRAVSGALSVGSVVKYATVIYRFAAAMSSVFHNFSEFALSAERQQSTLEYINIPDVLPKENIPVEKRAFCEQGDNEYEFELRNVSFQYPGSDHWALRNVSLQFHIGERLAIVGMNGSGKTTLIKLLCRLYDPTEGSILLNGIDIRKYNYCEYLSLFSVVFQDFKLFAFSLGENVAASAEYDRERVAECLKKAGFGERFSTLPDKEETFLYKGFDEHGIEISGGEAQKIALARALYKDAPFVILDEPTAALDPLAEYDIYKRFNDLVENKTAVYISHRLSSCRFCDDIAVFHEGRLIQRGNHDTLIADKNNKYYELWNAQARYYEKR